MLSQKDDMLVGDLVVVDHSRRIRSNQVVVLEVSLHDKPFFKVEFEDNAPVLGANDLG